MEPTDGELRVLGYLAMGLGGYHLVVTRRERSARDRIVRRLLLRGWLTTDGRLSDEGRAVYERRRPAR